MTATPGRDLRVRCEGFWSDGPGSAFPYPVPSTEAWPGRVPFLDALRRLQREAVRLDFKGTSTCRICGADNGGAEFRLGRWRWPSGYTHYVREHGVRPTKAFREHVRRRDPGSAILGEDGT